MKPTRIAAVAAAVLVLVACGGGSEERTGALDFVARVTPDAPRSDRLRAMSAASRAVPVTIITNAELFAYAEATFPALFPAPSQSLTVPYQGKTFDVRAYAATGNYIGIANGEVFGLGPFTNNQLQSFGTLESLTCTVNPARCQPGGGGGSLNECIDPRSSTLPTGFRTHLVYLFTSGGPVANFETTTDTVIDGPATFEGQSAVQTTITTSSTPFVVSSQGITTTTTTSGTIRSYEQPSANGLLKSLGDLSEFVSTTTTTISIPGAPPIPPRTDTTRSKTVETPPSENIEFTLAVGQSLDKTTTQVTTPLEPAGAPVTSTTTMRYTYEARETIAVQGRSFDTCRYRTTMTVAGTTSSSLAWFIVGKGVPARVQSDAAGTSSTMELKQGSTYDGQPL